MSHTAVSLVNEALDHLGQAPIQALTDQTATAVLANRFYDTTRRKTLRLVPWRFAMKVEALALSTDEILNWTYAYELPADCVRALRLEVPVEISPIDVEFEVVGDQLWTNWPQARLRYIRDITDPSKFDDLFADALSAHLAFKMAVPVTGDANRRNEAQISFNAALRVARGANGSEARVPSQTGRGLKDARL
jgi:hypothetical protein